MIDYSNPDGIYLPLGPYSHTAIVPGDTELVFISGQVGARVDGSPPETLEEQAELAFSNLLGLLAVHELAAEDLVKLSVFVVAGQDLAIVSAARREHLGAHRPTSTTVFVPALVDPAWLLEVEAIAARRPS